MSSSVIFDAESPDMSADSLPMILTHCHIRAHFFSQTGTASPRTQYLIISGDFHCHCHSKFTCSLHTLFIFFVVIISSMSCDFYHSLVSVLYFLFFIYSFVFLFLISLYCNYRLMRLLSLPLYILRELALECK